MESTKKHTNVSVKNGNDGFRCEVVLKENVSVMHGNDGFRCQACQISFDGRYKVYAPIFHHVIDGLMDQPYVKKMGLKVSCQLVEGS